MAYNAFLESIRSFFGITPVPPRNDFRNPIWSSDDEDDGDELYTREAHQMDDIDDLEDMNQEIRKQMQDMVKTFGSLFGEFKIFHDNLDHIDAFTSMTGPEDPQSEPNNGKNIRDYYLKPGYNNYGAEYPKQDIDLDGKISSTEISGLLNQHKNSHDTKSVIPFNGNMVPGRSYCQTIITTSITKPDGTIETRKIVKKGNEVIEETTTTTAQDPRGHPGLDQISSGLIFNNILSELSSLFRNYH